MQRKHLPYFFLAFLSAVLLFILGVRYGQGIERINKAFAAFMISPTPSPIVAVPTVEPTNVLKIPKDQFFTYAHPTCGASFLVPTVLEEIFEGTNSAHFSTTEKKNAFTLLCEKKPLIQEKDEKIVTINSLRAFESSTKDVEEYRLYNPKNGLVLTITVAKEYLPTLQKSLSLIK